MSVVSTLKDLIRLRFPIPDGSGNLSAQIVPRTGTVEGLLAVADAGDGELATTTDKDAVVVYTGNPSVGTPMYLRPDLRLFGGSTLPFSVYDDVTGNNFNWPTSFLSDMPEGNTEIIDGTTFVLPSGFPEFAHVHIETFAEKINVTGAAGETLKLTWQIDENGDNTWADMGPAIEYNQEASPGTDYLQQHFVFSKVSGVRSVRGGSKFRLNVKTTGNIGTVLFQNTHWTIRFA